MPRETSTARTRRTSTRSAARTRTSAGLLRPGCRGGNHYGAAAASSAVTSEPESCRRLTTPYPSHPGHVRVVHRYYANLDRHLLSRRLRRLDLREHAPHLLVIPIGRWDRISPKALTYSLRLSHVTALHCTELGGPDAEEEKTKIRGARSAATNH